MLGLVVVRGAGKGGNKQSGVSATSALIDGVGAVVECVGTFLVIVLVSRSGLLVERVRAVLRVLAVLLALLISCRCWWWCHR